MFKVTFFGLLAILSFTLAESGPVHGNKRDVKAQPEEHQRKEHFFIPIFAKRDGRGSTETIKRSKATSSSKRSTTLKASTKVNQVKKTTRALVPIASKSSTVGSKAEPEKDKPPKTESLPTESDSNIRSGQFSLSAVYTGDGTYYDPSVGIGACGWLNQSNELVGAMNTHQYGNDPNPNKAPICGKCATLKYKGKSVKVRIVDRCPVCKHGDIDLSPVAFQRLAPLEVGRIKISWSYSKC
ncbi:hypothetical protein BB560_006495 [Smittium megazygosporum]|uniref:RlpA-like protein double-psi beta-barrel domain-containing protein n=1 Tax=Smittium megazygosporum TaxID=133381 RepID=A0A2T9Y547_9FUNG|nr:hypothetical protein BB560_006495 [Smittium megazygosporum]